MKGLCFIFIVMFSVAHATVFQVTPATFGSISPKGGDTVQMSAGNYGTFKGGVTSSVITYTVIPGLPVSSVVMVLNLVGSNGYTFDGFTVAGGLLNGCQHIIVRNCVFSAACEVDATVANAFLLIDRCTFDNLGVGTHEGRLAIKGTDGSPVPSGLQISNCHFGGGGCSDGIDLFGVADGVRIGPGNEFTGIVEGNCSVHVDTVQFYGELFTEVFGNYFHDNGDGSGGIMAPDGSTNPWVHDNVFASTGYSQSIMGGGWTKGLIEHNVLLKNMNLIAKGNGGSGNVLRNNVFLNGGDFAGANESYNWGGVGPHTITGTVVFVGGANPTTYAGYALKAGSAGKAAGSDGLDIGIRLGTVPTPTPVPTVTPTPLPSPTPTVTPVPTATPTPLPSPTPTVTPTPVITYFVTIKSTSRMTVTSGTL